MRALTIIVTITVLHLPSLSAVWDQGEDRWGREFCKASFCGIMSASKWEHCCQHYHECCAYLQLAEEKDPLAFYERPTASRQTQGPTHAYRVQPPPEGPQRQPHPTPGPHFSRPQPLAFRPKPPSIRPNAPATQPHPPSSPERDPKSFSGSRDPNSPARVPQVPVSRPQEPPSRPHKTLSKPRKTAPPHVAPEETSDNEVYRPETKKQEDRWGDEFCKATYCGIMPSVKWSHCCDNYGQCCAYVLLAGGKDLKSPFAAQEIASVTKPKETFQYRYSYPPRHPNGPKTKKFYYTPQEQAVKTAPSTPRALTPATTSFGPTVIKQPFRPQRQASFYNDVYAVRGDKWGREYCRTSYCSIMPSSKWTHCCDNYRKCCAYVQHSQGKGDKNPFAFEEISIFSVPLKNPLIFPIRRDSKPGVQSDEPLSTTPGPNTDQVPRPETEDEQTPRPPTLDEQTPRQAPLVDETPREQTPANRPEDQTEDSRLIYRTDQASSEDESLPIIVPMTSESSVLERARETFNDVIAREEARQCRPRYCAILPADKWHTCCSRYTQCCAYSRYMEPRGPFYFEEDPSKLSLIQ